MSYILSIKTVGAQPNMSLKQLGDNLVALPNIDEQRLIAETLENITKPLSLMQQDLEDYKLLKKSLMEKLLSGKIRVNFQMEV